MNAALNRDGAPTSIRHGATIAAAVAGVLASAFGFFIAWLMYGFRCDESCSNDYTSSDWHDRASAWQWDVQLLFAAGGLIFTLVLLAHAIRGRATRVTWATGAAVVACWGAWAAMLPGSPVT